MYFLSLASALLLVIISSLPRNAAGYGGASGGESSFTSIDHPKSKQEATEFALMYGYPLTSFIKTFHGRLGLSALGTNTLFKLGQANPQTDTVVRENVDTVYAISILDLSRQDVVITVPPMQHNRYYLYAFYDPYGDTYATLGSLYRDKAGVYLLRPALTTKSYGNTTRHCKGYAGCIDSPTLNGFMIVRVELRNNSTDEKRVNRYVKHIKVKGMDRKKPMAAPFKPKDLAHLSRDRTIQTLQLLARLSARNPPHDPKLAKMLPDILRTAGIKNGEYNRPHGTNLTQAKEVLKRKMNRFFADPKNNIPLNNGWSILSPRFSGSFNRGRDLLARSFVAHFEYLQNTADQAIYPMPAKKTYKLSKGEAYVLIFSGKPPTKEVGFWSITIYNAKGFLIKNPQNIYALGDRSHLRYPNGKQVYGKNPGAEDKPFKILIQSAHNAPPKNWTSNWLPSPPNDEAFQLTLRLYGPRAAATNGNYQYPVFKKRKAY